MAWDPYAVSPTLGRRYAKAPIVEAVMDVRTTLGPEVDVDDLRAVHDGEADEYPQHQLNFVVSGGMLMNEGELSAGASKRLNGHVFRSADQRQTFQARLDGYTFSRLSPYDRWDTFFAEGIRVWRKFLEVARPLTILRIALRYINRIEPPAGDRIEIGDYLQTRPEVSPLLPQTLDGFFFNAQLPLGHPGPTLTLIETVVRSPEGRPALVLDIDVAWLDNIPVVDQHIETVLTERFRRLRDAKNAVFEACITDTARRLFE